MADRLPNGSFVLIPEGDIELFRRQALEIPKIINKSLYDRRDRDEKKNDSRDPGRNVVLKHLIRISKQLEDRDNRLIDNLANKASKVTGSKVTSQDVRDIFGKQSEELGDLFDGVSGKLDKILKASSVIGDAISTSVDSIKTRARKQKESDTPERQRPKRKPSFDSDDGQVSATQPRKRVVNAIQGDEGMASLGGMSESISAVVRQIKGTIDPTTTVVDLMSKMPLELKKTEVAGLDLADIMYKNSVLPDMADHIKVVIKHLSAMHDIFTSQVDTAGDWQKVIDKTVAADVKKDVNINIVPEVKEAMRSGKGQFKNLGGHIGESSAEKFIEVMRGPQGRELAQDLAINFRNYMGSAWSGGGGGGGGGGDGGGDGYGGSGAGGAGRDRAEGDLRNLLANDPILYGKGKIEAIGSFANAMDVIDQVTVGREINRATGGMFEDAEKAMEYQSQILKDIGKVRNMRGFSMGEMENAVNTIIDKQVPATEHIAVLTESVAEDARALGISAESVGDTFYRLGFDLRNSDRITKSMVASTLQIARNQSLTSRHVAEARKSLEESLRTMSKMGKVSIGAQDTLTESSIIADKLGVGDEQRYMMEAFSSQDKFIELQNAGDMRFSLMIKSLTDQGYNYMEMASGGLATTEEGMRAVARAAEEANNHLIQLARAGHSPESRDFFIKRSTAGRSESLYHLSNEAQAFRLSAMTDQQRADEYRDILSRIEQINNDQSLSSRARESLVMNTIGELTGDTSLRSGDDIRKRIEELEKSGASALVDDALEASHVISNRFALLMKTSDGTRSHNELLTQAMEEVTKSIPESVRDLTFDQIAALADGAVNAREQSVRDAEGAATANVIDEYQESFNKSMTLVTNKFAEVANSADELARSLGHASAMVAHYSTGKGVAGLAIDTVKDVGDGITSLLTTGYVAKKVLERVRMPRGMPRVFDRNTEILRRGGETAARETAKKGAQRGVFSRAGSFAGRHLGTAGRVAGRFAGPVSAGLTSYWITDQINKALDYKISDGLAKTFSVDKAFDSYYGLAVPPWEKKNVEAEKERMAEVKLANRQRWANEVIAANEAKVASVPPSVDHAMVQTDALLQEMRKPSNVENAMVQTDALLQEMTKSKADIDTDIATTIDNTIQDVNDQLIVFGDTVIATGHRIASAMAKASVPEPSMSIGNIAQSPEVFTSTTEERDEYVRGEVFNKLDLDQISGQESPIKVATPALENVGDGGMFNESSRETMLGMFDEISAMSGKFSVDKKSQGHVESLDSKLDVTNELLTEIKKRLGPPPRVRTNPNARGRGKGSNYLNSGQGLSSLPDPWNTDPYYGGDTGGAKD